MEQASISLVPPPILLVHGIWGSAASLQHVRDFLSTSDPWLSSNTLILAIGYPNDVAFTEPGAAGPAGVLDTNVGNMITGLDQQHIVGGRVDVVAHSMGGLVAAYYTSLSKEYRTLHDRGQGRFHEIISLDTPEYGSALAQFLYDKSSKTYNPNTDKTSGAVWRFAKCTETDTVEQCFATLGMPLAPAGQNISTGAVASLIPGSASLAMTPLPGTIPNLIWRHVSALRPQHVTVVTGESMLEVGLERLIAAVYPAGKAPSISQILRDAAQDDVIVTLQSQLAKVGGYPPGGDFVTLPNLSHTPLPINLEGFDDWILNNDSVENSPNVNTVLGCWLKTAGDASCATQVSSSASDSTSGAGDNQIDIDNRIISSLHEIPKDADDRLSVPNIVGAKLATPIQLTIRLKSIGELEDFTVDQSDGRGHRAKTQHPQVVPVSADEAAVAIVPMFPGSARIGFGASFKDNAYAAQNINVSVGLPDAAPIEFYADVNLHQFPPDMRELHITLDPPQFDGYLLQSRAVYATVPDQPIDVSREVSYRVIPSSGDPVIRVQPGGAIEALHPGEATVEARFGAAIDDVDVVVTKPR